MSPQLTLQISERTAFADGHAFGETGAYERLTGKVRFRADPEGSQPHIVDLDKAPRDSDGLVEYVADFCLLKPVDPARGNRRVFFDYGNRGNKRALQFFNDAAASSSPSTLDHAGNGYLMRRGYTIAWLAWQGDLLPGDGRMLLEVPIATENGKPITGTVRNEYIVNAIGTHILPLSGLAPSRSYPAASLDTSKAKLSRRRYAASKRQTIPADAWSFSRVEASPAVDGLGRDTAVIPSDIHLHLHDGFEPGWIYELIYEARDPRVYGLGHLAVRDFISFLKHADTDAAGAPNPLRDGGVTMEKAYAWGRSQTGRLIRDFIYLGFNADAENRRVFDGVLPHVAGAGKKWMNHRFAHLSVLPGQEHENHYTLVDRFPFSYAKSTDHFTGVEDAILKRPETDPLVIHTDSASEYWHRRASLVVTDTQGNDLAQPDTVRMQCWASSQHYASPRVDAPTRGIGLEYQNTVVTSMFFRANLDALDRWATDGTPPPPSQIPSRGDGTLVTAEDWRGGFPAIPGVMLPNGPSRLERLEFGEDVDTAGTIAQEPPPVIGDDVYPVFVPATDADGLDRAGLRAPMVQAPLGTYTGWSVRKPELGLGAMVGITGSYIPFRDTAEERVQTGDPRPAVLERYADAAAYVAAIRQAAEDLVAQGLMLEEDVDRAVAAAAGWNPARHVTKLADGAS